MREENTEINLEEHINLVNYVINKYYKQWIHDKDFEDLKQAGYLGLCKAKDKYDPEKGSFSTYAVIKIRGEIGYFIRKEKEARSNTNKFIYLDKKFREGEDDLTFEEKIDGKKYEEECAEFSANDFRKTLKGKDKRIFDLMKQQYTYEEIGELMGLSRSTVKYHAKKIRRKFKDYMFGGY